MFLEFIQYNTILLYHRTILFRKLLYILSVLPFTINRVLSLKNNTTCNNMHHGYYFFQQETMLLITYYIRKILVVLQ